MSSKMANLEKKFDAISAREQKLLFYALPLAICFVFILGLIEPTFVQTIETRNDIRNLKVQLMTVSNGLQEVETELSVDPDIKTKNQIAAVEENVTALKKQFANELEQLVPPGAMPSVLEQLFAKATKLRLMEMRSLPPRNIFAETDTKATSQDADQVDVTPQNAALYQHGLRITFEGSFFDTRDFLLSAEQMGWKLHWKEILFDVNDYDYPKAKVQIELFTLSMSEVYINVN